MLFAAPHQNPDSVPGHRQDQLVERVAEILRARDRVFHSDDIVERATAFYAWDNLLLRLSDYEKHLYLASVNRLGGDSPR